MLRYEDLISFTTDFTDGSCSSSITSCWYREVRIAYIQIQQRIGYFYIPWSYPNISSTLLDMRQSATLGHFQDHAPCMQSLEVIDLWNLLHQRRLSCVSSNGQKTTIWWHTGGITRNVDNRLTRWLVKFTASKRTTKHTWLTSSIQVVDLLWPCDRSSWSPWLAWRRRPFPSPSLQIT